MNQNQIKKFTNKNEIRIIGLSRSGNHAIINWLINQLEGSYCFLNCVEPKHNPFYTARPFNEEGQVYNTNISAFNFKAEQEHKFSVKDYLLYNYEDCFLGMLNHQYFKENREKWLGNSLIQHDVLIIRDVFNLFASRIKSNLINGHQTHHGANPISTATLKRLYKQHAREFLGQKNNLKDKTLINYNLWVQNKDYRKEIAEKLNVAFTDNGFEEVISCAGGSSFDGMKFSGNANQMKVSSRWKEYASEDFYWDLFDEEVVELTKKNFGNIPPVEYWEKEVASKKKSAILV